MKHPEVWLRGNPPELDALRHLLLCTLQQTREEVGRALESLLDGRLWDRPHGLTPVGFHVRHIAESIDRLLTYAQQRVLSAEQLAILPREMTDHLSSEELLSLLNGRLSEAEQVLRRFTPEDFERICLIGRAAIPVPLGTLLAHVAEHTQRHLGQIATTVKLLRPV